MICQTLGRPAGRPAPACHRALEGRGRRVSFPGMAHVIERAKSGRAVCKTCQEAIAQGELRFGEEIPNAFSGRPGVRWHHLRCGADARPAQLLEALAAWAEPLEDRGALEARAALALGQAPPTEFPFAERARTAAVCKHCGRDIAAGALRIAVERREDFPGWSRVGAAYLHPECGRAAGLGDEEEALIRTHSRGVSPTDLDQLSGALGAAGSPQQSLF